MYVDNHPAIASGREFGAFPKKLGVPRLYVDSDPLRRDAQLRHSSGDGRDDGLQALPARARQGRGEGDDADLHAEGHAQLRRSAADLRAHPNRDHRRDGQRRAERSGSPAALRVTRSPRWPIFQRGRSSTSPTSSPTSCCRRRLSSTTTSPHLRGVVSRPVAGVGVHDTVCGSSGAWPARAGGGCARGGDPRLELDGRVVFVAGSARRWLGRRRDVAPGWRFDVAEPRRA